MAGLSRLLTLSLVLLASSLASPSAEERPRVLAGFVLQSQHGPPSQVIATPEALAEFVACLPEELPHKQQPAPSNPDALRTGSLTLDFRTEVLVVCVHRDTISAFPDYKGVVVESEFMMADFDVPAPPPESRPYGWGVYTAVILPKSSLPIRVRETAVKGNW